MPDVKYDMKAASDKRRLLLALSQVKDMRKSLAEAEYLRRLRQQRTAQKNCVEQDECLTHYKATLPQQKAAILAQLAAQPVDLQKIHSAHDTVRKLHDRLEALEQEHKALEETHRQACAEKELAHGSFTAAIRQQEKFQTIRSRNDAQITQESNAQEQAGIEDRPHAHSHPSLFQ